MTVVPWLSDRNVAGTTDPTGAMVKGCTALRTDVRPIILVPGAVLNATGVANPFRIRSLLLCS